MRIVYEILSQVHAAAAALMAWLGRGAAWLAGQVRHVLWLALGFTLLAVMATWLGVWGDDWLVATGKEIGMTSALSGHLVDVGLDVEFTLFQRAAVIVGGLCVLCVGLAFWRRPLALKAMVVTMVAFAILWAWLLAFIVDVPAELYDFDYKQFSKETRNEHWIGLGLCWLGASLVPALVGFGLFLGSTHAVYQAAPAKLPWGDRLLVTLQSGGRDPRYRTSSYWANTLVILCLLAPAIMALRSCGLEEPYGLIKGRGEPAVQVVVKKEVKKKKRKELIVNVWSPYIFQQPDLDDSKIIEELEKQTSDQYVAQAGKTGKLGRGGPGPGGWPKGMENAKIRFIRLEYDGGDWDQDMGKGADYNLLLRFHEITGFKIAEDTEHLRISRLRYFPKDYAPPFVFLTGKGGIRVSSADIKTLRWYCLEEGGCLFIDNGGGTFHSSVTRLLRQVFPDKELKDIANDDPILQAPFSFPNGAPPFWHHAGRRAKGIRADGRWVVFYHPGDINDAWKTGHSGSPELAEPSYRLGINVMYYTFNQYYRIHFEK